MNKERTRDELIDSIIHTRTREHRVMPGFHSTTNWEERKAMNIDCDKVNRSCLHMIEGFTYNSINGYLHVYMVT